MDEDAPPTASLNEYEAAEPATGADTNFGAQVVSPLQNRAEKLTSDCRLRNSLRTHSEALTSSPFASAGSSLHPAPSSSATFAVHVFGFPTSALDLVLDYFSQFGDIASRSPSPEGGNWVTIEYTQPWSAARAARKNGEVLGGVLMVGVKVVDEDHLKRALAASESGANDALGVSPGAGTPRPVSSASGAVGVPQGGSTIGRPVQVFGPGSAFKSAPTPSKKGFLGLGAGGASTPQQHASTGQDPHASLFAEKSKQAAMQQQGNQGQKGMLGKVSDLVFGW